MNKFVMKQCIAAGMLFSVLVAFSASAVGDRAPIDINLFHPSPDTNAIVVTDLAQVNGQETLVGALSFRYGFRPLTYFEGSDLLGDVVRHRATMDLALSWTPIPHWLQVSMALPVTVYQQGDMLAPSRYGYEFTFPTGLSGSGAEDIRLGAKFIAYSTQRYNKKGPWQGGVGFWGDLTLPTGDANAFLGSKYPTFSMGLIAHLQYKRVTVATRLGAYLASAEYLYTREIATGQTGSLNIRTGSGLVYAVGINVDIVKTPQLLFSGFAEVNGQTLVPVETIQTSPAQMMLGAKLTNSEPGRHLWSVSLGVGPGLNPGTGVPDVQTMLRVSYGGLLPERKKKTPPVLPNPPNIPPAAVLQGKKIVLLERLYCKLNTPVLTASSSHVLSSLATLLKDNPSMTKVEVGGHSHNWGATWDRENDATQCAELVVQELVRLGVDASRLVSKGYGVACPVGGNHRLRSIEENNRVELVPLEENGLPLPIAAGVCHGGNSK